MRRRQGFTLVEMLVALALVVFIMTILSEAFVAASRTFRDMKAAGDMADQLRSATAVLRRSLAADHFEGKRRLSDPNFWSTGPLQEGNAVAGPGSPPVWAASPPQEGFFRVYQGTQVNQGRNVTEGAADLNNLLSFRSVDHMLHFTVKLRGNNRSDFFSATAPGTTLLTLGLPESRYQDTNNNYNSQWAEVVFFLRAIPDPSTGLQAVTAPTPTNPGGVPLYGLFMRQLLAAPDNSAAQVTIAGGTAANFPEISGTVANGNLSVNSPRDLTEPARRFGMTGTARNVTNNAAGTLSFTDPLTGALTYPTLKDDTTNTALWGADLLLTNVLSFDVRLLAAGQPDFLDMFQLGQLYLNGGNPNNPTFNPNGGGPMVFDTWSCVKDDTTNEYAGWQTSGTVLSIPMWNGTTGPNIQAIQITLRIWNDKAQTARQVTIEVPL